MSKLKVHVLTLFPEFFGAFKAHSMVRRAEEKKLLELTAHDLRRWTHDKHRSCDDRPFGGGPGMLMKPEPIFEAMDELFGRKRKKKPRFVYLTPRGKPFNQKIAKELAKEKELVFLCGHYEGVDQRVIDALVTDELSLGDYILTGGEIPVMAVIDAALRHVPGVLGKADSTAFESFTHNLLEYPHYTRPAEYRGLKVPGVLLSGDHPKIDKWRMEQALAITKKRRPDLLRDKE